MGLGEIRLFAGSYAPQGWAFCDGMPGRPDLRGRVPTLGKGLTRSQINIHPARPETPPAYIALNYIIATKEEAIPHASSPFVGEIRPFAFAHAPRGWAHCDGQWLPFMGNESLYYAIGEVFGIDHERMRLAVPDLRGAYVVQPQTPTDYRRTGGAQLFDEQSAKANLLSLNYCIATQGYFPQR